MPYSLEIEPEWNIIKKIKERIVQEPVVIEKGQDYEDAVLLTAIELVENALKYSEGEHSSPVVFSMDLRKDGCEISVTNPCTKKENLEAVKKIIEKLSKADPFELYVERLEELRDNPDGYSRMGLIRIAYEADLRLSYQYEDGQLTITATCK